MSILLKNCKYLVTQNEDREILNNVDVGIKDKKVEEISKESSKNYEKIIDCSEKIVMPGLINTHTHAGMAIMRGYSDDKPLFPWLDDMWELEKQLTPRKIKIGASLSILEMLKTGTTSFVDMYFDLDEVPDLIERAGIKGYIGSLIYDPEKLSVGKNPSNH